MSDGLCIAHVHTTAGWGGGENQVLRLMTGLRERGVKAVLFARARGELLRRALGLGLPARSLPRLLAARHVARALAEEPFDVVHVHDSRAVAIGTRAARARGIPVVASRRVASPLRRNPVSHRKYSPRRLAAIIAISETVKRVVLHSGYPEERVFVAADAVDAGELDAVHADRSLMTGVSQGSLAVGIGRLSEKKNWGLLLGTAARMKANGRAMQWAVIGDGPLRHPLEQEARRLDLGDCVHFLGFRHDALSLLKGSDLLFFPSRMEGASVTVREAMILGIPVVAAAAEGTVES
ncbi:MAG: glycosyltransferase, partial [Chloroflexi bacterium]|nr:glycosyltransferase [Chloroflexota bacterium]